MIGKIQDITKETCYVTLFDPTAGDRFEAECNPDFIKDQGLKTNDEFEVQVTNGMVSLKKLAPKKVTSERVKEIKQLFSNRWTF